MNKEILCKNEHNCYKNHKKYGPSSFSMHNYKNIFNKLNLKENDNFLDLGCGAGDYSIYASNLIKDKGKIYSIDYNQSIIYNFSNRIKEQKINNIKIINSNIKQKINLTDNTIDICLVATVLHATNYEESKRIIFSEIARVMRNNGRLAIIECKKENTNFGPPIENRISEKNLIKDLNEFGFKKIDYLDLETNYFILFKLNKN
ncbi:MAG: class I SAM-dependent methyltransferase [Pleomorphochaeta sp.]